MQLEMGPHFPYLAAAYAIVLTAILGYSATLVTRARGLERRAGSR